MKTTLNTLFQGFWYLGGLDDIDPRIGVDEDAYGPTYGNRLASHRAFDGYARRRQPQAMRRRERRVAARPVAIERRVAPLTQVVEPCGACA